MSLPPTVGVVMCRQEGEHGRQPQQQREQRPGPPKRPNLNPNSNQLMSAVGVVICKQVAEHGERGRQQPQTNYNNRGSSPGLSQRGRLSTEIAVNNSCCHMQAGRQAWGAWQAATTNGAA